MAAALVLPVAAQVLPPLPTESVVVVALRLVTGSALDDYVGSLAAPSPLLEKIARWKDGICPVTAPGCRPRTATPYVPCGRIRRDRGAGGREGGAPTTACAANIEIVFTTKPQVLLDGIRKQHVRRCWAFAKFPEPERIATMRYPVQAWYTTETEDESGLRTVDDEWRNRGVDITTSRMEVSPNLAGLYRALYDSPRGCAGGADQRRPR